MYDYWVKLFKRDFLQQNTLVLRTLSRRFVQNHAGRDGHVETFG
jgi:hypothetical protein